MVTRAPIRSTAGRGDVGPGEPPGLAALLARAAELRPVLRAEQQATEERGTYSPETHDAFWEAGFYRILQPRRFGGLELGVPAFYRLIAEVARGCPSTAWCLCLGAGHALQVGSYFSERAQREIFGLLGQLVSPASGHGQNTAIERVPGGYEVSGKWRYCSGVPYSTHFMGFGTFPGVEPDAPDRFCWFVVPGGGYTILDDWGGIIGMKGSGSNSVVLDGAFVPDHFAVDCTWFGASDGPTAGSALHGNPVYGGTFEGFAEGEIAAVTAGTAMAAVDEYVRIITTSNVPHHDEPVLRADHPDYQRWLGMGLAWADAAAAISVRGGQLYEEYARLSVEGIEPFGLDKSARLNDMYFASEQLAYDTVELFLRNASSSAVADGQAMQRYFRDMVAACTRADQLERMAAAAAGAYLRSLPAT
ncbi:acyl-CoA dehydrogenase [Actinomadura rubrisoli]|uniref:Acyl-CoA dehydrogenase n=1 Tax=Actinomadura rubrisoli TaxID=2530368 RepID=A0A4R5CGF1_9ACTN|nr:acyl-CoA dehydrogenase [Actinomadura rubrisoli]